MSPASSGPEPSCGQVWLVNFDPSIGSEMQKKRRALVVNPDSIGRLPLRIVVPLTTWDTRYAKLPWMVHIAPTSKNGITKDVAADCFQVKSLSRERFLKKMGIVTPAIMKEVIAGIAICIGL